MLSKLIKYEFRATKGLCLLCIAAMILMTFLGVILVLADAGNNKSEKERGGAITTAYHNTATIEYDDDEDLGQGLLFMFRIVYGMICVAVMIAISFVIVYYFFYRYYKNYFTDEGYLMHTLPVESGDLIKSKLIVACCWQYLAGIVFTICLAVIIFAIIVNVSSFQEIGEVMRESWAELLESKEMADLTKMAPAIVCCMLASLISPIPYNLFMYVAVGLGQKSKTHKLASSIGMLFLLFMVQRAVMGSMSGTIRVMSIVGGMHNLERWFSNPVAVNLSGVLYLAATVAVTVGLYLLDKYLIDKHLNLE